MAKHNFTVDQDIVELQIEDKRYEASDTLGNGLCIRVSPSGAKTFIWRTRYEGKQRVKVIGDHPRMTANKARVALDGLKERAEDGTLFTAQKVVLKNIHTVRQLAEDFYQTEILPARTVGGSEQARMILDKYILPSIGSMKLRSIKAPQAKLPVTMAMRAGYPRRAEAVLRILKQMFSYGEADGLIDHSPAASLNIKRCGVPKAKEGTRMPDENTLPVLWSAIEQYVRSAPTQIGLKILLLSGVRSGELRQARWSDVDFDNAVWHVPDENSKTVAWSVPLSSHLMILFKKLHGITGDTELLFPSRDPSEPSCRGVFTNACAKLFRLKDEDGEPVLDIPKISPHNFRRTMRTIMGDKLNIEPYVAEGCLNHKVTGVEGVYNKSQILDKRMAALEAWGDYVDLLVTPRENVSLIGKQA